jgi:hygromycin-B 4-O-kinase
MTVGAKMELTIQQVRDFLDSRLDDVSDITALSGGQWSQAFAFKRTADNYVIRFGQHHDDYIKDQLAGRYASTTLPIPKVLEIGEAFGGYFAISERAFGTMIDDQDKVAMRRTIPSLFATMDAIRTTDISETSGFGEWDTTGNGKYASWQELLLDVVNDRPDSKTYGWKARLKDSPVGDEPFNAAYANLTKLAQNLPDVRTLIHNDLLNDHKITAVIDWANALYGDFLYDLAQFTFWEPLHEPVKNVNWEAEALKHYQSIGLEVPMFRERLQCCMVRMGLDAQAYYAFKSNWELFEAVARRTLEVSKG